MSVRYITPRASPGGDHHAGRRVLEDVVDGVPEDRAVAAARRAEHDDLRAAALRLVDDRPARLARADDALDGAHAVALGGRAQLVEQRGRPRRAARVRSASSGSSSGTTITRSSTMRPGALGREPRRELDRLVRLLPGDDRDEDRAVLERERRPERDRRARRHAERHAQAPPVEQVEDEPGHEPGEAGIARRRVLDDDDEPGERRCRARRRSRTAASRCRAIRRFGRARHSTSSSCPFTRSAITAACAIVNESIAPNAYIRPRKSTWPESRKIVEPDPGEDDQREPRRLQLRVQPAEHLGQLPVASTSSR